RLGYVYLFAAVRSLCSIKIKIQRAPAADKVNIESKV
ncbi:hypothetical protein SMU50_01658, partial [Streptococcus mutans 5SM3]